MNCIDLKGFDKSIKWFEDHGDPIEIEWIRRFRRCLRFYKPELEQYVTFCYEDGYNIQKTKWQTDGAYSSSVIVESWNDSKEPDVGECSGKVTFLIEDIVPDNENPMRDKHYDWFNRKTCNKTTLFPVDLNTPEIWNMIDEHLNLKRKL